MNPKAPPLLTKKKEKKKARSTGRRVFAYACPVSEVISKNPKNAPKQKKAPKPKAPRSHLEARWISEWNRQGGPRLEEEFMFHPTRKWRADFAHLPSRTLIEIEGGAAGGRHTRIKGFEADMEKYLTAHLHGWEVVRIGAKLVRGDIITAVIGRMREKCAEKCADSSPAEPVPVASLGGAGESGGEDEAVPDWLRFEDG